MKQRINDAVERGKSAISIYQANFGRIPGTALALGLAAQRVVDRRAAARPRSSRPVPTNGEVGAIVTLDALAEKDFRFLHPIRPCLPVVGRGPSVTLLIPSILPSASFGGVSTALRLAATLADQSGSALRVVCTDTPSRQEDLNALATQIGLALPASSTLINQHSRQSMMLDLRTDDDIIATTWWTALLASQLRRSGKFVYLVQDDESGFYAPGDYSVLAASTYSLGNAIPVVNTSVLLDHLRGQFPATFNEDTLFFEPAIDRARFRPDPTPRERRTLFFYARPDVPRNLFFVGLEAISIAIGDGRFGSGWDLVMAGSTTTSVELRDGRVIRALGKLPIEAYASLSGRVDVALALMASPHPSYPPLELAASGASVVTNAYAGKRDLTRYSPNIVVCDADPADIAKSLAHAHDSLPVTPARLGSVALPETWAGALDGVTSQVVERLRA